MHAFLSLLDNIKKLFINGLLTLLPITITVAFFSFLYRFFRAWLAPLRAIQPQILQDIPFSEFVMVLVFVIIVGLLTRFFLINRLWAFFESVLGKIPLLRPVYFGIKQLLAAFSPQSDEGFQKIALIEFPRKGIYSIGFLTCPVAQELAPTDKTYYSAFIPATPNPTTGYYILVEDTDCIIIDITKQEAMTLIISGGIVQPERFSECKPIT